MAWNFIWEIVSRGTKDTILRAMRTFGIRRRDDVLLVLKVALAQEKDDECIVALLERVPNPVKFILTADFYSSTDERVRFGTEDVGRLLNAAPLLRKLDPKIVYHPRIWKSLSLLRKFYQNEELRPRLTFAVPEMIRFCNDEEVFNSLFSKKDTTTPYFFDCFRAPELSENMIRALAASLDDLYDPFPERFYQSVYVQSKWALMVLKKIISKFGPEESTCIILEILKRSGHIIHRESVIEELFKLLPSLFLERKNWDILFKSKAVIEVLFKRAPHLFLDEEQAHYILSHAIKVGAENLIYNVYHYLLEHGIQSERIKRIYKRSLK